MVFNTSHTFTNNLKAVYLFLKESQSDRYAATLLEKISKVD